MTLLILTHNDSHAYAVHTWLQQLALPTFLGPWWSIHWLKTTQTCIPHYNDVIMGAIASQITSLTIIHSIVYSDADQRKHQSSTSLAFVRRIHRGPVKSPHKWPVTRKMFPFDDVIMLVGSCSRWLRFVWFSTLLSDVMSIINIIFHDDVIKWKHFRVTGRLCGEFTGHWWIPRTKPVE